MTDDEKSCRFCAEVIKKNALLCKHCGKTQNEKISQNENTRRCTSCDYEGAMKLKPKGNIFIEIILWLCWIIPGIIYSIWSRSGNNFVCPQCGNNSNYNRNYKQIQKQKNKNNLIMWAILFVFIIIYSIHVIVTLSSAM